MKTKASKFTLNVLIVPKEADKAHISADVAKTLGGKERPDDK